MLGVNYSNVQYAPGSGSLFTSEAVFNTYGLISTYRFTPTVTAGIGYSYTRASKSNGVSDAVGPTALTVIPCAATSAAGELTPRQRRTFELGQQRTLQLSRYMSCLR